MTGAGNSPLWIKAFRPDVLFIGTSLLAVFPYAYWSITGQAARHVSELTYIPIIIWGVGLLSFLLGTRLTARALPAQSLFMIHRSSPQIDFMVIAVIALIAIMVVWAVDVYGTLPILSYVLNDGRIDVITANDLQKYSAVGQIGVLNLTLSVLTGLTLLVMIVGLETNRRRSPMILICLATLALAHTINGKRQGLFVSFVFLLCGLSLYWGNPVRAFPRLIAVPRSRFFSRLLLVFIIAVLFFMVGYLSSARMQGAAGRSSMDEIIAYLEYPLLNFEAQCITAGFGPSRVNLIYPFRFMLPFKWIESYEVLNMDPPPRVEPTAPAGIYELIHWSMGLLGVVAYSFLHGAVCMWFYSRSRSNLFCLLTYCQIAYALSVSFSFNLFLIVTIMPAPAVLFLMISRLVIIPVQRVSGSLDSSFSLRSPLTTTQL